MPPTRSLRYGLCILYMGSTNEGATHELLDRGFRAAVGSARAWLPRGFFRGFIGRRGARSLKEVPPNARCARRPARAAPPPPRGDGGAGQRAGAARQNRGADRRQHGGGGLLGL